MHGNHLQVDSVDTFAFLIRTCTSPFVPIIQMLPRTVLLEGGTVERQIY